MQFSNFFDNDYHRNLFHSAYTSIMNCNHYNLYLLAIVGCKLQKYVRVVAVQLY